VNDVNMYFKYAGYDGMDWIKVPQIIPVVGSDKFGGEIPG
jgi:hypothetical protein